MAHLVATIAAVKTAASWGRKALIADIADHAELTIAETQAALLALRDREVVRLSRLDIAASATPWSAARIVAGEIDLGIATFHMAERV